MTNKAIQQAIQRLKEFSNKIYPKMVEELLQECCMAVMRRANERLALTDIGSNVKDEIATSWKITKATKTSYALQNNSEKSVYVEFGVGIVGEENPHENATEAGYDYNIESVHKYAGKYHDDDTWRFYVTDLDEVDLKTGHFEHWDTRIGTIKIITRGSPATMYVFNALQDFIMEKEAFSLWGKVKTKYLG